MCWSKKKKISKECWNLNYSFILWLKERLPVYVEEASKVVNLEYHKFNFRGEEYTQLQLINKMIELVNYLTEDENYILYVKNILYRKNYKQNDEFKLICKTLNDLSIEVIDNFDINNNSSKCCRL